MPTDHVIFAEAGILSILAGRKTQFRRVCDQSFQKAFSEGESSVPLTGGHFQSWYNLYQLVWVKESWRTLSECDHLPADCLRKERPVMPEAGIPIYLKPRGKSRRASSMPLWVCRLSIKLTGLRSQRLQDLSEDTARAEGIGWRYGVG